MNAAVHRDYAITGSKILLEVFDRRIDITNPGALPNHMTVDRVRAGANPRSRNESIAHFMSAMGFMEQRDRGWLIMRREMGAFNGTEPELMQDERNKFVGVTFRLAPGGGEGVTVYKFGTVVPIAFQVAGQAERGKHPAASDPIGEVRRGCRDSFRKAGLLHRLIPGIEEMLAAGGFDPPPPADEVQPIAIPETPSGDVGHRG